MNPQQKIPPPPNPLREVRARLFEAIIALEQASVHNFDPRGAPVGDPTAKARAWLKATTRRSRLTAQPLQEGAWAILLDLFASQEKREVSVSSACIASGHPPTTALRWIKVLEAMDLLERRHDKQDGRRILLELTPKGLTAVLSFLTGPYE